MSTQPPAPQRIQDMTTQTLLDLVQQLALELHPHKHQALTVTLDSALERDLGFDSLGRMELLLRLERTLGVRLSEQVLANAESPRDLLHALQGVSAATASHPAPAHLINRWFDAEQFQIQVLPAHSTSAAALAVAHGETDACITTDLAREQNGLVFITDTIRIHMIWSIFVRRGHPAAHCLFEDAHDE